MQREKFGHVLNLKITNQMLDEIDRAIDGMKCGDWTRSKFLRLAVGFALLSLAEETKVAK